MAEPVLRLEELRKRYGDYDRSVLGFGTQMKLREAIQIAVRRD